MTSSHIDKSSYLHKSGVEQAIRMMVSLYYQNQNAASGLYCQAKFFNCLSIPKEEDKFESESILTERCGLGCVLVGK